MPPARPALRRGRGPAETRLDLDIRQVDPQSLLYTGLTRDGTFYIENGEIKGMVEDVAYQSNTQEFWNSCVQVCDERDYRLNGSFFDGKGQPGQVSAVSHGSATARFDGVNVINTARSI